MARSPDWNARCKTVNGFRPNSDGQDRNLSASQLLLCLSILSRRLREFDHEIGANAAPIESFVLMTSYHGSPRQLSLTVDGIGHQFVSIGWEGRK